MYFSIGPKNKKEEFFNYEEEYNQIKRALKVNEKIIAIFGVRRVGKTSLMNVIFNEIKGDKIWIDGRIIEKPKKEIPIAIYNGIKGKNKIFGKIESLNISIMGVGLELKISGNKNLEEELKKVKKIYVFIDEAQKIGEDLEDVLAYFYDRFPNITFIVSGSEVGLLEKIMGESSKKALFGRHIKKIYLKRLNRNMAREFLRKGFRELDEKIGEEELEIVINELDGLIGWLTLYGYEKGILKNKHALKKTKEIAVKVVAAELFNFLKKSKNKSLYLSIIRNANGLSWSELNAYINKDLKKHINPNSLNQALNRLLEHSFLIKKDEKYFRSDPLLLDASFYLTK